jgi:putative ABC transport system substrate-binding protein
MRRREFLSSMVGWLVVPAQAQERARRIGVLTGIAGDDSESKARSEAFLHELERLGWNEGRNLQIDYRSAGGNAAEGRKYAAELVSLRPDVILAIGTINVEHLLQVTRTVPIVFTIVTDPVGSGMVESLSQPGGNVTGFMLFEYSLAGKWLELLKQMAPGLKRAAVLRDSSTSHGIGQFAVIQSVAPTLGVEVVPVSVRSAPEIERGVAKFANLANTGLVVTSSPGSVINRKLIVALATRHRMPAVYLERLFVSEGGLVSYGPNFVSQFRLAAGYVDRILKGEKPANLPVQVPTKYELAINLKTAKALGLSVPPTLLARADEVIE